jgi:hypothetical protein
MKFIKGYDFLKKNEIFSSRRKYDHILYIVDKITKVLIQKSDVVDQDN